MLTLDSKGNVSDFALLVGASRPTVQGLVKKGVLVKGASTGDWLLAYCAYLRERAAGRSEDSALASERRMYTAARRKRAEVELQAREDELIRRDVAERDVRAIAGAVVGGLENLRARLAP